MLLHISLAQQCLGSTFGSTSQIGSIPRFRQILHGKSQIFLYLVPYFLLGSIFRYIRSIFRLQRHSSFVPQQIYLKIPQCTQERSLCQYLVFRRLVHFNRRNMSQHLITTENTYIEMLPMYVVAFIKIIVVVKETCPVAQFNPRRRTPSFVRSQIIAERKPTHPSAFLIEEAITSIDTGCRIFRLIPISIISYFIGIINIQ